VGRKGGGGRRGGCDEDREDQESKGPTREGPGIGAPVLGIIGDNRREGKSARERNRKSWRRGSG
jgi:hypothetical protein